jgi:Fe-S-cluster-containing dehydrogenase component
MKNSNDNLKEKTIRANELENVSGGSGDAGTKYQIIGDCRSNGCDEFDMCECADKCPQDAIITKEDAYNLEGCEIDACKCIGCTECVPALECYGGFIRKV